MKKDAILIAMPSDDMRALLRQTLQTEQRELVVVRSGGDVFVQAARSNPSVIIAGCNLPDMDGVELCRKLRIDAVLSDVPIVILGDSDDDATRLKFLDANADYYIPQGASGLELQACVNNLLRVNRYHTIRMLREQLQRALAGLHCMEGGGATTPTGTPSRDFPRDAQCDAPRSIRYSLTMRGARGQFMVALALITIIPWLTLWFLVHAGLVVISASVSGGMLWLLLLSCGGMMALGITVLLKYPRNIVRMRRYLEKFSAGALIGDISLSEDEDDLRAIAACMHRIIFQTEERIRMIQRQEAMLRTMDRERIMIESLGAACHHLGQPTTVLTVTMHMIKRLDVSRDVRKLLDQFEQALNELCQLLESLQNITEYRTESYISVTDELAERPSGYILAMPPNDETTLRRDQEV